MSDEERRIFTFVDDRLLPAKESIRIYMKDNNIVVGYHRVEYKFAKNRFFCTSSFDTLVTVSPRRVFCSQLSKTSSILSRYFSLPARAVLNRTDIRTLLTKGPSAIDCREMQFNGIYGISASDLKYFTTNADVMRQRCAHDVQFADIVNDMIRQAKALNRVIKSEWSDRKISDTHNKWTAEIQAIKCRNCSSDPIWDTMDIAFPDNIRLINSERECADEGAKMHHCVYTNYWYAIKDKRYVAIHVNDADGDYTVGIRVKHNQSCEFDQAFKAWNQHVSPSQREYAQSLVKVVEMMVLLDSVDTSDECETILPW